ncbi:hypothetical protein HK098_002783, partial [Nowakowskiella sp. JEL0407]
NVIKDSLFMILLTFGTPFLFPTFRLFIKQLDKTMASVVVVISGIAVSAISIGNTKKVEIMLMLILESNERGPENMSEKMGEDERLPLYSEIAGLEKQTGVVEEGYPIVISKKVDITWFAFLDLFARVTVFDERQKYSDDI